MGIPKHRPLEGWNFKSYFWIHKTYCKVSGYLFNSILDAAQHRCIGGPAERVSGQGRHLSSEPMSSEQCQYEKSADRIQKSCGQFYGQ